MVFSRRLSSGCVDGVPVRAVSGYELSRVRTELYQLLILPTGPPYPVQPHGDSSCGWRPWQMFFLRASPATSRSRCQSNCRRPRFSGLGTHTLGKLFSMSSASNSCASLGSVFCLRTLLVLIFAASTDPHLDAEVRQQPLEPARTSRGLHPHAHADRPLLQIAIKLLGFSIAVFNRCSPHSSVSVSANPMY
jgi:hypothetical protein